MDLREKVTDVVETLCNALISFTSLDVSNRVKQGGFESTRHRDIAHIVRIIYVEGLMEDYGYSRSMIDVEVGGDNRQAYLYHHQSVSPSAYDRRNQVALPPQVSTTQVPIPTAPVSTTRATRVVNTNNSQVRKQKGDCRLEIPPAWVRQLGWSEGTTIYAIHENDILLKSPSGVGIGDTVLATATVVDGRLRVPKTAFEKAGFQSASGTHHEVVLGDDSICVKDT